MTNVVSMIMWSVFCHCAGSSAKFGLTEEEEKQLKAIGELPRIARHVDTLLTARNLEAYGFSMASPSKGTHVVQERYAEATNVASDVPPMRGGPKGKSPEASVAASEASAVSGARGAHEEEVMTALPTHVMPKKKTSKDKGPKAQVASGEPIIDVAEASVGQAMSPVISERKNKRKSNEDAYVAFLKQKMVEVGDAPDEGPVEAAEGEVLPPVEKRSKRKKLEAHLEANKMARKLTFKGESFFSGLPDIDMPNFEDALTTAEDAFQQIYDQFDFPHSKEETDEWEKTVTLAMHRNTVPLVNKVLSGVQRPLEDLAPGPSQHHVSSSSVVELLGHVTSEVDYHMNRAFNMYKHAYEAKKALVAETLRVKSVVEEQDKVLQERKELLAQVEAVEQLRAADARAKERAERSKAKSERAREEMECKLADTEAKLKAVIDQQSSSDKASGLSIGEYKFWLLKHNELVNQPVCFKFERAFGGPFKVQRPRLPSMGLIGENSEEEDEAPNEE